MDKQITPTPTPTPNVDENKPSTTPTPSTPNDNKPIAYMSSASNIVGIVPKETSLSEICLCYCCFCCAFLFT